MKRTVAMIMALVMMASMFTMAVQADEEFFELVDESAFYEVSVPVNSPDSSIPNPDSDYPEYGGSGYLQLTIVNAPSSIIVYSGNTASFTCHAVGVDTYFEWQKSYDGVIWEEVDCDDYILSFNATAADNLTYYRCIVYDVYGDFLVSDPAVLYVRTLLAITEQPASEIEVAIGSRENVSVEAVGDGLSYRWYYSMDGAYYVVTNITGAKTDTLVIDGMRVNEGYYFCVITDGRRNSVQSNVVHVTVTEAQGPIILSQPRNTSARFGTKAVFTTTARGDGLTYRWQYSTNGGRTWLSVTSSGYNTNTISVTANTGNNGKLYRCRITDAYNRIAYTDGAMLTVR